jgi:polysaccharide biosynthesis transport protein
MLITNQDMHLRDYLKVIKKHRRTVATFFCITFVVVLLGTFAATPQYEGTTKVMIEKVEPSDLTGRYHSTRPDPEFYETQFQLIKSRAVAHRVVEMLSLGDNYDNYLGAAREKASWLQSLWTWFKELKTEASPVIESDGTKVGEHQERPKEDLIADAINEKIKVRPVNNSRIVTISYMSPHPEFASLVANATAKAYIEETLNMKMDSTRRTLEWMTKKAEEEGHKLENAEKGLQTYMRANDIVTLENRVAVVPERLSEISTQLVRAESKREELEALDSKIRQVANDQQAAETVAAIAADPALQTLRTQIVTAEKDIMELSGKFGPKHPAMKKALGDLNILKKKKEQETRRIAQSIRNEYELALSNEKNLRAQLDKTKTEALRLNEKFIQYGAMKREVDTNRQLYDALMLKIKEQSMTEENKPVDLWIVEKAGIPIHPAKPLKTLNLLMGLILGLFGGIGLAFFIEYLDNTVKHPEEMEAAFDTPVLGIVSLLKGKSGDVEQTVLKEPRSAFAESFKALRTALLLSSADAAPKKILITSPSTGEGKTTTSVNLALALAQSENRVLLIDGDMRRPSIHKIFKLNNNKGLSTYLTGATGSDGLQKGPLPNLVIMTSGPIPPNPSELLTSKGLKKLLENTNDKFDIVVCDSPPLLSVADSLILSRVFDGTVMVTKSGQTTYDMAAKALKSLRDINAHVLGLVINAIDLKKSDYYYYASYEEEQTEKKDLKVPGEIAPVMKNE